MRKGKNWDSYGSNDPLKMRVNYTQELKFG